MGVRAALLIAVGQYADSRFAKLRAPVADTEDLRRVLADKDIGGYDVQVLSDPTCQEIRLALDDFFDGRKADDMLLLYFSCHGVKDRKGALYLTAQDSRLNRLPATAIAASYVQDRIEDSLSKAVVVLLDCCYSGAFSRDKVPRAAALNEVQVDDLPGRGTAVLTASTAMEYAFEGDELTISKGTSSYFTRALVDGLETGAADRDRDGWVSVAELYDHIFDRVRELNPDQHPTESIKTQGGLKVARAPKLARRSGPHRDYFSVRGFRQTVLTVDGELYCVDFARDQSAVGAGGKDAVHLWYLPGPAASPDQVLPHPNFVYTLVFSGDGRTLVTGCEDGTVRFWDWREGRLLAANDRAHDDAVYAVAVSGDGRYLATGGYDGRVNLWNPDEQTMIGSRQLEGRVSSLSFAQETSLLAIGSLDDRITLWDLGTNETSLLGTHESSVESVAFSPDGTLLASCGLDKRVCLWDMASRGRLWARRAHEYLVKSVSFSPDGQVIVSASWDSTARLWDARGQRPAQTIPWWRDGTLTWHTDWIWSAVFARDGRMLASTGSDGRVVLWEIGDPSA